MMFELLRRKAIAKEIINQYQKSERQMNISEMGRMLDLLKLADYEDAGIDSKKVKDPVQQHEWVNIAVDFRARNLARCDFKLYTPNDKEITSGPIFDLFEYVNPQMSKYQLWEATESWRMVRGEAIWILTGKDREKLRKGQLPQEILVADPNKFKIQLNTPEDNAIIRWVYFENPESEAANKGIPFEPFEIIQFRIWNKWDYWRGVNYWIAQEQAIEQDFEATRSNTNLLKNKSIPPGILSTEQIITQDQAEDVVGNWEKQHKGPRKVGRIAVTGRGMKYQAIAMTHSDMQYFEMKKWNRVTILAKAGIPPVLVSVKDESTPLSGTDTKEQERVFWSKTMLPEIKAFEDKLQTEFFQRFNLKLKGEFDTNNIEEMQEDYGQKIDRAQKLSMMGWPINMINEKLDLGLKKVPWGDTWWKPFNLMDVNENEKPEPPKPEPPAQEPPKALPKSSVYSTDYLYKYFLEQEKKYEPLFEKYRRKIKNWFYAQRAYFLDRYGKAVMRNVHKTYEEFQYWVEQEKLVKDFSKIFFLTMMEEVGKDLFILFRQQGWSYTFDVYQTQAPMLLNMRIDKLDRIVGATRDGMERVLTEAIQNNLPKEQVAGMIRDEFRISEGRSMTIARTEMANVKSDTQISSYLDVGILYNMWQHNPIAKEPRENHMAMSGEVQPIGQLFSNGLMYPHDPNGPPEETINCNCEPLPATREQYGE